MSLPMCSAKAPPILTIFLAKKIEAHAQQFIQFTVDSNTGSTNIVEQIIFWYLMAPPPPGGFHNLEDVLSENLEVTLLDNIAVTLPVSSVNKM
ncbi:hypothetical protein FIBSPDRAFT_948321 [Athelia psychrophila]|uniref:Uncharacterized protein n=1 Tax=Athelia psychrophila TaxID=1759441 RepID=A0A166QZT3_9AGAM|nr:hypothetical protein FIBSPDRAFT_948321 [Fibularhizoctonia sp. CBS 109695]